MNSKGFSLIEVLICLLILGIGLLAVAGMQVVSVRGNFFGHHLTQASYAAQDKLEFLNNLPFDSPELQAGSHGDETVTVSGIVFSRSYSVVNDGGLKTIRYRVTWNDGVDHDVVFSTIRSH